VKPLTKYDWTFEGWAESEDGSAYLVGEADARIRHYQDEALCAEEAAMTHAQRIAELEPPAKWFGEVMAILHGDGGHYLARHGAEKAALDAVDKYHALVAEREAARADAERYWGACNYALAAHYGRLSPMHNHWAAVIEKAMAQDTKGDAARSKE
jgi:hypothetical protein